MCGEGGGCVRGGEGCVWRRGRVCEGGPEDVQGGGGEEGRGVCVDGKGI